MDFLPPSLTVDISCFLVESKTDQRWQNKAFLVLGEGKGGMVQGRSRSCTEFSASQFFHLLFLPQNLKCSHLPYSTTGQRPQSLTSSCSDARVSAYKTLLTSGSLLRRLGSNQDMQTSVSPSSVPAHLCFMPLLILYVLSASHPTSEQGNSHSSRTYSNEASSKALESGVCPEEQLFGRLRQEYSLSSGAKAHAHLSVWEVHRLSYMRGYVYIHTCVS